MESKHAAVLEAVDHLRRALGPDVLTAVDHWPTDPSAIDVERVG